MQVELVRVDKDFHFKGTGSSGISLDVDGSPKIGGHNAGARPMETLLIGLGACSAMDIISILRKQKIELTDFKIKIEGEREEKVPSVFKKIEIQFILSGSIEESKVRRAIELSLDKYCSVAAMLNKTAEITYSLKLTS